MAANAVRLATLAAVLLGSLGQANDTNATNGTSDATGTGGAKSTGQPIRLDNSYLNPSGSTRCHSRCRHYFAGAAAGDGMICQKQASGVGTPEQNFELGVACYPAYGCGQDMITCVDQAFEGQLPDTSDAAAACANLNQVQPENPWQCGTAEEGRTPCVNNTANNNIGKWLKATADLACGWGSTYGGTVPGYEGNPTPATQYFTVSSEYDCCLKAMSFENSSWEEGGAALFFQLKGDQCRVDRETIIYGNMDSSSGRSVKYQDTRCGDEYFYYRHAAGAADAANLHTGGRCVVEGGFTRLSELSTGANLPGGEIFGGAELPNSDCPTDVDDVSGSCNASVKINTINDAEECCEFCRTLNWLPQVGGVLEKDENGTFVNPCVAWQIVEGKCRIIRQAYYDNWFPGWAIKAALTYNRFDVGHTDWVVPQRGCGTSVEACNYYSFIYYRQFRPVTATPPPEVFVEGGNSTGNATYRKVVTQNISTTTENMTFEFNVSSLPSRRDRRAGLVEANANQAFANLSQESFEDVVVNENGNMAPVTPESASNGTDCGRIEIYPASALRKSGDYEMFDEESSPVPICVSECVGSGETATFFCNLQNATEPSSGRRLAEVADSVVVSFTAVGSGYDNVNFGVAASVEVGPEPEADSTSTTASGEDGDAEGASFSVRAAAPLVAMFLPGLLRL